MSVFRSPPKLLNLENGEGVWMDVGFSVVLAASIVDVNGSAIHADFINDLGVVAVLAPKTKVGCRMIPYNGKYFDIHRLAF